MAASALLPGPPAVGLRARLDGAAVWVAPSVLAGALAAAYLLIAPPSADLAAQLLRTRLFAADPFGLWNNWWFSGQYTLSYSVLFPAFGALLGTRLVGALAAVAATAAFGSLVQNRVAACCFAVGTGGELLSGRLTLMLGLACAAAALLALRRRSRGLAALLALATALASPVAALVLLLAAAAIPSLVPALALAPVVVLAGVFPTGGDEPFALSAFLPVCIISLALAATASGTLRRALLLYGAGCLAAFLIHTPVGGNIAQLGELLLAPLAALLLRGRPRLFALCALPLLYLQLQPGIRDAVAGAADPSTRAAYYRPLIAYLTRQSGPRFRIEVPLTAEHWESYELAPRFPLARGWERQSDIADDPLFYGRAPLTLASYEAWLHEWAVRYVAVPDVALDASGRAEARLARRLVEVAAPGHWRVYAVPAATSLVSGARLAAVGPASLTIAFTRPGRALVRVRYSRLWRLGGIPGTLARDGALLQVTARGRGRGTLTVGF